MRLQSYSGETSQIRILSGCAFKATVARLHKSASIKVFHTFATHNKNKNQCPHINNEKEVRTSNEHNNEMKGKIDEDKKDSDPIKLRHPFQFCCAFKLQKKAFTNPQVTLSPQVSQHFRHAHTQQNMKESNEP